MEDDIKFPKEYPADLIKSRDMPDEDAIDAETRLLMSSAQALAVKLKDDKTARNRLKGYVSFLLDDSPDRQYYRLADFLDWYGTKYLLTRIQDFIKSIVVNSLFPKFSTYVELGPGTGWLIGGLASFVPNAEFYAVDRRPEIYYPRPNVKFYNTDLENEVMVLPKGSLIIANQFLHCIDNWGELIEKQKDHWWVVIEPEADSDEFPYWYDQMELFGAKPITQEELALAFETHGFDMISDRQFPGQKLNLWRPAAAK